MDYKMGYFWERDEDGLWQLNWGQVSPASMTPSIESMPNPTVDLTKERNLGEDLD